MLLANVTQQRAASPSLVQVRAKEGQIRVAPEKSRTVGLEKSIVKSVGEKQDCYG